MTDPMLALHEAHHATLRTLRGGVVPLGYGDFAAEAEAIFSGVGILHLGAGGAILVRGPDAGVFLNGLTTNNVVT
ncbi:MAG: hypothetical protein HY342_08185, partial [Candidatus Lambdaproteobacteria bacterium]|nr:hypothetical protein [Candidatus Lambdaproteobacteria bacterium]